jgi:hypothetical protein
MEMVLMTEKIETQPADAIRAHRVRSFCERIGISASTFWKYERLGKIKTIRIGGRVLVPHAEALRIASEGLSAPQTGVSSTEAA